MIIKSFIKTVLAVIVLLLLYLAFWPVAVDPVAWESKPAPSLDGKFAPNDYLAQADIFGKGDGIGPEDIEVDSEGRIYAPYEDGRVLRYDSSGENSELFVNTGGRPLGMEFDADGNLIICDAKRGLLSVSPDGELTVLATEAGGVPFKFTDDVDIAQNGTIYFTDASHKFGIEDYRSDIMEHRGNGRLLAYHPISGETSVVKDGLYFANGVAVSPDQMYVLVNETSSYTVQKVRIAGEKAGTSEVLLENLPGIPDGISSNGKGTFWIAFPSKRKDILDNLSHKPFMRKLIMRLPESMQPAPEHYGFVIGIDGDGNILHNLQDPSPESFSPITSVEEHDGMLFLGSLTYNGFARVTAP
ncbi:MAG: SMP-30/gluconolactonase/LRE family protein [Candidatus Marinimicrobia bacterium]|nr:SMP-30/gluconolactonase/LRE family protein [Candidatus Neomarinimicrobiota bacterium]